MGNACAGEQRVEREISFVDNGETKEEPTRIDNTTDPAVPQFVSNHNNRALKSSPNHVSPN